MASGSAPSRANFTSCAFGAWKRNVTLSSECTSGVTSHAGRGGGAGAGLGCWAMTKAGKRKKQKTTTEILMVPSPQTNESTILYKVKSRRTMVDESRKVTSLCRRHPVVTPRDA